KVVSGYDVVQDIENTPTAAGSKPKDEIKIIKAYLR
ncbi:MAG: peptidylprolyl isomerase, partial [Candidatus Omnitrophica bacterium]|nr:peptidylprolyl isomerase [Candidatus Omnitrophota bacterium]